MGKLLDSDGLLYVWQKIKTALSKKVDKVDGKGLSTNDYTTAEKNKLGGIAAGAEVNVQSDWNATDTASDDYIKNKPTKLSQFTNDSKYITISDVHTHSNKTVLDKITQDKSDTWDTVTNKVDKVAGKGLSTNDYTTAEKNKLSGIASGAEVNVQSDWNVIDDTSDAFIKNKPTSMPASDVPAWAKQSSKPSYTWSEIGSKPATFPSAPHSHSKSEITDMPTKLSEFTNDKGYITSADVDTSHNHDHTNKAVLDKVTQAMLDKVNGVANGAEVNVQADWNVIDNTSDAFIKNKPTSLPASDVSAWAKSPTKPNYTKAEVGLGNVDNTKDADKSVKYAETAGSANAVAWSKVSGKPTTVSGYGIKDAAIKLTCDPDGTVKLLGLNDVVLSTVNVAMDDGITDEIIDELWSSIIGIGGTGSSGIIFGSEPEYKADDLIWIEE